MRRCAIPLSLPSGFCHLPALSQTLSQTLSRVEGRTVEGSSYLASIQYPASGLHPGSLAAPGSRGEALAKSEALAPVLRSPVACGTEDGKPAALCSLFLCICSHNFRHFRHFSAL